MKDHVKTAKHNPRWVEAGASSIATYFSNVSAGSGELKQAAEEGTLANKMILQQIHSSNKYTE